MEAMEPAWLQAIHPRTATAKEGSVKGAFQYNGGHGLTTFFVNVELAEPLRQQLAGQGLDPVDTVAFCQATAGSSTGSTAPCLQVCLSISHFCSWSCDRKIQQPAGQCSFAQIDCMKNECYE